MCIIIDANKCDELVKEDSDLQPVKNWIEKKNGKIVFVPKHPIFIKELEGCSDKFRRLLEYYRQNGLVTNIDAKKVETKRKTLKNLQSNDDHIIALALVSGAKILVSGDKNLHEDFKNKENGVGGKVYQYKKQKHLLTQNTCP